MLSNLKSGALVSNSTPFFPPLIIASKSYEFKHLEPFTMSFHSNKAAKNLRVNVRFSNHCFTHSPVLEETYSPDFLLPDHAGRERVFCPIRYNLSHSLEELVKGLNDPKCKVYQTAARRNFNYSIQIEDPAGPYHLFFEVSKATGEKKKMQDLSLFVESAYPELPVGDAPKLLGRIGFQLLCTNIYLNKPTSTKR